MSKVTRFTRFFFVGGAVATVLSACDVQVHDTTPEQYPANYDVGMYEIKATVAPDALVTANPAGTEWHGLYAVRCQASFPLQIAAIWKIQGITTKQKVVPEQARQVKL